MSTSNYERSGLAAAEYEVLRRHDAGMSAEAIATEAGYTIGSVRKALSFTSEAGTSAMYRDLRRGSEALRQACAAEAEHRNARFREAYKTAGCSPILPIGRAGSALAAPAIDPADPRPVAFGREPCPRCGTRGDLGCAHQRPDPEAVTIMENAPC